MATRITRQDARHVYEILLKELGKDYGTDEKAPWRYVAQGDWEVLIGGWPHHPAGWSRGFMVSDVGPDTRGHRSPEHDGGRYEGRGWHARMVQDIVAAVRALQLRT